MVRLTAELIHQAPSYINPLDERELCLRGHKIPAIENLGVAAKGIECIDFTDNEIKILGGFPHLTSIANLIMGRNLITQIHPTTPAQIPNLTTLSLGSNRIEDLKALNPLASFKKLSMLSLVNNPVQKKEHYRLYVIWLCPNLEVFDYQMVSGAEVQKAKRLFGTAEEPTDLAMKVSGTKTRLMRRLLRVAKEPADHIAEKQISSDNGSAIAAPGTDAAAPGPSAAPAQRTGRFEIPKDAQDRIVAMIQNAKSLDEIDRLTKMLEEGKVPE